MRLAVIGRDLHVLRALYDVIVGYSVTVGGDEEARTLAGNDLMVAIAAIVAIVGSAEPPEQTVHRRALRERILVVVHGGIRRPVDLDADRDHPGLTLATMSANPIGCC